MLPEEQAVAPIVRATAAAMAAILVFLNCIFISDPFEGLEGWTRRCIRTCARRRCSSSRLFNGRTDPIWCNDALRLPMTQVTCQGQFIGIGPAPRARAAGEGLLRDIWLINRYSKRIKCPGLRGKDPRGFE